MTRPKICIVGGGISGLSTSLCIIEEGVALGNEITILSEKFYDDTTSYIAAGFFRPDIDLVPDIETGVKWYTDSYNHFKRLEAMGITSITGVKKMPGYALSSYSPLCNTNSISQKIFSDERSMSQEEMKKFPSKYKYGVTHTTFMADPQKYLKYLESQLLQRGVKFIQFRVNKFEELCDRYNIIVNCTGIASKYLANDNRMVAIRGQVVKVKNNPEVTHFYYADEYYILPGVDWVTLGGTKIFSNSDLNVSKSDKETILRGCYELLPSLKQNEEIRDMVGLRPYRSPVRIECESLGGGCFLIHNYGHGGQGVNLSWGTARAATELVAKAAKNTALKSKL